MRRTYIWELAEWPHFQYDLSALVPALTQAAETFGALKGLLEQASALDRQEAEVRSLVDDAVDTSAIEGERIDRDAARGSIVRRLSLPGGGVRRADDRTEGVVEITLDALKYDEPFTEARLLAWHSWLFPIVRGNAPIENIGKYRDDSEGPMTVQTHRGAGRDPIVHYEAPPANRLSDEMQPFIAYVEGGSNEDPMIRAAIAHLWYLLIHPFEDGNGRTARALADLMLGRARGPANRYCSLSRQILREEKEYYAELEYAGYNGFDVTRWVKWFLECYARAAQSSCDVVKDVVRATHFFGQFGGIALNERQQKIVRVLLDGFDGKMNASRYAHITHTSHDTANRDLADLVSKGVLAREGGSKNTSYHLTAGVDGSAVAVQP